MYSRKLQIEKQHLKIVVIIHLGQLFSIMRKFFPLPEMFFPSFAFRGPRGFPFVFVDSDSDDDCYYFHDDSSDDDDDNYMFNGCGRGYRQFQNRYETTVNIQTPEKLP